jgi:RNA polymerase sigma factor (sigma-70 family)
MEEDNGDIGREHFLGDLSAKQEEAVELLYADTKMDQFLGNLVYSFRQGQDKNDLRQDLAMKVISEGPTLSEVKCLRSWLNTAAVNICRNDYRHMRVVKQHHEKCVGESMLGKMRGGAVVLQRPAVKSPEQLMQEHEQEQLLEDRLHGFFDSLPRDVQVVAWMWDEGRSPAEIAEAIGKSVKTVYRHHRAFQKELVKRCLASADKPDEKRLREVVEDLSRLAFVA